MLCNETFLLFVDVAPSVDLEFEFRASRRGLPFIYGSCENVAVVESTREGESLVGMGSSAKGADFRDYDFPNFGFAAAGTGGLAFDGRRDAGEFHALEGGLDSAEAGAGDGYFVGGEDEA